MKLEVGMYVRTNITDNCNNVYIRKIDKIDENNENYFYIDEDVYDGWGEETIKLSKDDIKKASFNIVDLIKSKDIILGKDGKLYQCWKIYKDYVFTYSKNKQGQTVTLVDYQIDKILTRGTFEFVAYKVS